MLLFVIHYFYTFSLLRDVIISCVYFSNDILFVFMIAVATMDHNAEILRVIGHLWEIGSAWRDGDEIFHSFSDSLLTTVDIIARSNNALYSITSYRKRKTQKLQHVQGFTRGILHPFPVKITPSSMFLV